MGSPVQFPEDIRDFGIIVDEQGTDAVTLQVVGAVFLAADLVLIISFCHSGHFLGCLNPPHDAVVIAGILTKQDADAAQDVINVWVREAETKEKERFGNEIALKACCEELSGFIVGLIIVLQKHGVVGLRNVSMHFEN